jgi:hypothetical protein
MVMPDDDAPSTQPRTVRVSKPRVCIDWLSSKQGQMALAAFVALAYTGALLWLARGRANFCGDDFNAFRLANELPMLDVVLTPSDLHFSPLQRLASYAIYKLAPLNFDVALAVLVTFHLLGVFYLYKTLELIRSTVANVWLCFWYATNVYLSWQFLWWSSAVHRLPHILFSIVCVYNYLCYRRSGSMLRLLACFVCWIAAAGFFAKAVLLPALLLGIEICLIPATTRRDLVRNGVVILALFASSAAFTFLWLSRVGTSLGGLDWNPARWLAMVRIGTMRSQLGWFGIPAVGLSMPRLGVLTCSLVLAFLFYSIVRAPRSILAWIAMLAIVAANILMGWEAPRSEAYRLFGVLSARYYFELMFVVVLFAAFVFDALTRRRCERDERGKRPTKWMEGLEQGIPGLLVLRRRSGVLAISALMAIAGVSFRAAISQIRTGNHGRLQCARFVQNLVGDISALHEGGVGEIPIAGGRMPVSVLGFLASSDIARYENFMPMVDPAIDIVDESQASYRVGEDGHLIAVIGRGEAAHRGPR